MTFSPKEDKAIRLVMEDRVTIRWHNDDYTAADGMVDGDTATYHCSFSPAGRVCTCPAGANHRDCSHALALELLAAKEADALFDYARPR